MGTVLLIFATIYIFIGITMNFVFILALIKKHGSYENGVVSIVSDFADEDLEDVKEFFLKNMTFTKVYFMVMSYFLMAIAWPFFCDFSQKKESD